MGCVELWKPKIRQKLFFSYWHETCGVIRLEQGNINENNKFWKSIGLYRFLMRRMYFFFCAYLL